jgi:shikimate kinase
MKIFIIGPGGVGKSTCGKILANLLGYKFIDLDVEFGKRVEDVGSYIRLKGYDEYCLKNSELFYEILSQHLENFVFAVSSGFLVYENMGKLISRHKQTLKESGISVLLLPSESLYESTQVVVKRQLSRGFDLKEDKEKTKFIQRFSIYKKLGDIKIFSNEKPEIIAGQMKKEITFYNEKRNITTN